MIGVSSTPSSSPSSSDGDADSLSYSAPFLGGRNSCARSLTEIDWRRIRGAAQRAINLFKICADLIY